VLPAPVAPGQSVTLEFESGGDILYQPSGDSYWLLGFEDWYPNPGLGASAFTWLCEVKVKKPFVPLASGTEIERRTEGDWNIVKTEFTEPVFLPIVMAGKYLIQEEIRNGRKIRIAGYAFAHKGAAKQMINLASQIIEFDELFLGPFPWKELTIIEINDYGFGVAPPGTMFITQEAFSPIRDDVTRYFSKGLNERYAHEIAHQYWGHQVKWAASEDEWLSESFAEYCAALFVRRLRGESAYRELVAYWRARSKEVGERATIATANRLLGERGFDDRTDLLYNKGPYVLSVLNRRLGEEKFLTALKTFQSSLKGKVGSTALFQNLIEFIDKKSYAEFFDQNVWDTSLPEAPK
jgi:aminopeptidase N